MARLDTRGTALRGTVALLVIAVALAASAALGSRQMAVGALAVALLCGAGFVSTTMQRRRHDRQVEAELARQLSVAARAVAHTRDLQRSRKRLITAREEERRRIQRDLHDGLGPALAGIGVQLEVSRGLVKENPDKAERILESLAAETRSAIESVRELVHDLRPPVLDQLGLVAAIEEHGLSLSASHRGLRFEVIGSPSSAELRSLPAAVEVASYRIAREAMTNVSRHAGARHCDVTLSMDGALRLEVVDDGCGLPDELPAGVGMRSMRERAGELGGSLVVELNPTGGTRVVASIPVATP